MTPKDHLTQRLRDFQAKQVGVAVSGGADSMALLHLTSQWAKETGATLKAITVDHGARAESLTEAEMVGTWCAAHGIEHTIKHWSHTAGNFLEQARRGRFALIKSWAGDMPVFLGHTKTDRAETILMRLLRGSGVDGLAGMQWHATPFCVSVFRPLIDCTRDQLRTYCLDTNLPFCDDPSNDDLSYLRVKVRAVSKELDIDPDGLIDTARRMTRAQEALEYMSAQFWHAHTTRGPSLCIDLNAFQNLPEDIQLRVLVRALAHTNPTHHPPRERALEYVLSAVTSKKSATLAGCLFKVRRGQILCEKECRTPK